MSGKSWLALIVVSILLLVAALCIHPVRAQDHSGHRAQDMPLHEKFYKTWTQPTNRYMSCCNDKDCSPAASTFKSGKWYSQRDGEWIEIPNHAIETERDSPDGQSHLCAYKAMNGWHVYCFLPAGAS